MTDTSPQHKNFDQLPRLESLWADLACQKQGLRLEAAFTYCGTSFLLGFANYLMAIKKSHLWKNPDNHNFPGTALRTMVYQDILESYIGHIKEMGYTSMFIWACPPFQVRKLTFRLVICAQNMPYLNSLIQIPLHSLVGPLVYVVRNSTKTKWILSAPDFELYQVALSHFLWSLLITYFH